MPVFRSIVFSAALAGLIVGVVISIAQFFGTVPLIQQSEVYERKAAATPPAAHEHAGAAKDQDKAHSHESEWEPEEGFQRNAFTVGANILTAIGFALLLSRGLCDPGPASDVARRLAVGARRLCGVHRRTRPRPAAGIAGHAGGSTDGAPDLVDRHRGGDGRRALPAGLPPRRLGRGSRPRPDRAAASDRRAAGAGIPQRGSCRTVPSIYRRGDADQPVVLGAAGRRHQHRVRADFARGEHARGHFGATG